MAWRETWSTKPCSMTLSRMASTRAKNAGSSCLDDDPPMAELLYAGRSGLDRVGAVQLLRLAATSNDNAGAATDTQETKPRLANASGVDLRATSAGVEEVVKLQNRLHGVDGGLLLVWAPVAQDPQGPQDAAQRRGVACALCLFSSYQASQEVAKSACVGCHSLSACVAESRRYGRDTREEPRPVVHASRAGAAGTWVSSCVAVSSSDGPLRSGRLRWASHAAFCAGCDRSSGAVAPSVRGLAGTSRRPTCVWCQRCTAAPLGRK